MNLNPLKKDDNTDALVKALEDANAMGGTQPAAAAGMGAPDSNIIANDPQVASSGVTPTVDTTPSPTLDPLANMTTPDSAAPSVAPPAPDSTDQAISESAPAPDTATTDTSAGIAFSGNDLPEGLSSDADAHLPSGGTGNSTELDTVKNSALEQLRPLIEKLDLEPADKFDKYLMMLRASDDPALIKPAFEAAQGIDGEKEKAQALLDIINEINYITANQTEA